MRAILLCAGFGTRLYPITRDRAKPLLPVAGRTILDRLLDLLASTERFEEIVVVSNRSFLTQFESWREAARRERPGVAIRLLDDGATANENRLGAVSDLGLAVREVGPDSALVAAGDNLFQFRMDRFVEDYESRPRNLILIHREVDRARLRRTGVAEIDGDGRLLRFHEKPADPPTEWASPAFYLLEREALLLVPEFLRTSSGSWRGAPPPRPLGSGLSGADAPGHFIAWLAERAPVFTHLMVGRRLDVGDRESYERAASWVESTDE